MLITSKYTLSRRVLVDNILNNSRRIITLPLRDDLPLDGEGINPLGDDNGVLRRDSQRIIPCRESSI
uniref:Uncharacterized protein n=1 Tax=Heterorhabditis bacteriophora TaxID=37862 RepID=A0A1I7WKJ0_HETBA